jgi:peptidoglycan/LPS O-acetylase OafA/YrhL
MSIGGYLSRHLSRRTSGRALIPEIDGLRSLAILSVVVFHAAETFRERAGEQHGSAGRVLDWLLETGEYGVPLFFAISGFILALPFSAAFNGGQRVSLVRYLVRRVTRLEPPYFVALLASFGVMAFVTGWGPETVRSLLASLVYAHHVLYREASPILTISWSLEVEVQFYLLMPALALIFMVRPVWVRWGLLAAGALGLSIVFGRDTPIWGRTILHHGAYFLVGLLLAELHRTGLLGGTQPASRPRPGHIAWDLAAVAALAMVFVARGMHWHPAQTAPWLILIGYAAVFRGWAVRRVFRWTPVVILGGMCYTIYLWHYMLMVLGWPLWERLVGPEPTAAHLVAFVAASSAASIVVCAVLFALIERPTMDPRWPQKLWGVVRGAGRTKRAGSTLTSA